MKTEIITIEIEIKTDPRCMEYAKQLFKSELQEFLGAFNETAWEQNLGAGFDTFSLPTTKD